MSERNSASSPIGNKIQLKCNLPSNTLTIDKTKQKPKTKKKKKNYPITRKLTPNLSGVGWVGNLMRYRFNLHTRKEGSKCTLVLMGATVQDTNLFSAFYLLRGCLKKKNRRGGDGLGEI